MKGIILAGGSGTRLFPLTTVISKQLLPVYDKPMIYYPLSTLMMAGIKEIMIITTSSHVKLFQQLLGNGTQWGIRLCYEIQENPNGLPEAFIIGEKFIKNNKVCLILGDNIFYGPNLSELFIEARKNINGATIFGYQVSDPERYGVIEIDKQKKVLSIKEKPKNPKSNIAITGVYFCDEKVSSIAKELKPSLRHETEIVDLLTQYLNINQLNLSMLERGTAWLDTGTHEALDLASRYVSTIENRQGIKIACLEEIALNNQWICKDEIMKNHSDYCKSSYGNYVLSLIND